MAVGLRWPVRSVGCWSHGPTLCAITCEPCQGRARFQLYQKLAALGFAVIQAVGQLNYVRPFVADYNLEWLLTSATCMTAGAMILIYVSDVSLWGPVGPILIHPAACIRTDGCPAQPAHAGATAPIRLERHTYWVNRPRCGLGPQVADNITELKLGNGTSILIFANIASALPTSVGGAITQAAGTDQANLAVYAFAFFLTTLGIVYVQEAERKIPINYASRYRAGALARQSYLPFKVRLAEGPARAPQLPAALCMPPAVCRADARPLPSRDCSLVGHGERSERDRWA